MERIPILLLLRVSYYLNSSVPQYVLLEGQMIVYLSVLYF